MLCKKALTHENLSSALQITFHFMRKNIFHVLELYFIIAVSNFNSLWKKLFSIRGRARALLLKLHFATFSHWESFSASVALHSLNLLSCTKHSISVLRSSKLVILCIEALIWLALQKSSNTWKSVFCIANNISWERSIFHVLELYS